MTPDDLLLERLIADAKQAWERAQGPVQLRRCFENFRELVARRSAAQVERLERARGIFTEAK